MSRSALWEAVKEILRLAVFAAISAAIAGAIDYLSGFNSTETWVVVGLAVLRFADKWIHERKDVASKGLLPF